MELSPGLHRVQAPLGERFVALYLVVGDDAVLLVDTGISESITDTLLPYLDAHGIDRAKLRYAVNTHCDFDHTGGNGALKAAIPTVHIVAHRDDVELTENIERLIDVRYGEFRETDGFDDPPETTDYLRSVSELVPVDVVVTGGETFDLGGRSVTVIHVPGHSPGHVAVYDETSSALLIGDAILGETVPYADGRPAFPPTYRDTDPYLDSLAEIRGYGVDLLLTAHYPVYSGAHVDAFLDESENYVAHVDAVIEENLSARSAPVTTIGLIRSLGDKLGPWGPGALEYAIFPVTGNLERLEQRGRVVSSTIAGLRHWAWVK